MRNLRKTTMALACVLGLAWGMPSVQAAAKKKPLVQMAILLDTSSSMDGLINQARSQLWKIVNELIASKKNGQRPEIQVALYEYGKSSLPSGEGYMRMIVPLTTDLDRLSEELFALKTNGGDEYCGQVIQAATQGLDWSKSAKDLKLIFIAGNEPFTQGPVDYRKACKKAIAKGIVVNTIHCGNSGSGVSGKWKDGAMLADGRFLNIDQNRKVIHIAAPQDQEIARLDSELSQTYVSYGRKGKARKKRQMAQDKNAASAMAGAATQRAVFKSSASYSNSGWDLVDAQKEGKVKLEELEEADLPEPMQKMSPAERKTFVAEKQKKRASIQKRIQKLNQARKKFVADQQKEMSKSGGDTLDAAMIKAIREQATQKDFRF